MILERLLPWRKQKLFRKGILQDLILLVFNGHYLGALFAFVGGYVIESLNLLLIGYGLPAPESLKLVDGWPLVYQFFVFFVLKDFIEWWIHVQLHRNPILWQFHKLHHSIVELDWIGNFRFHPGEIVVYRMLSYLPLVVLGVDGRVILLIAVLGTIIGNLNHSNVKLDPGMFRYIINSPRMHVWHHDIICHGRGGQNFGISLSVWDWLFGTAYWPDDQEQPEQLGFDGMEAYPETLLKRLLQPFLALLPGEGRRQVAPPGTDDGA